jgi:hypothetical protein
VKVEPTARTFTTLAGGGGSAVGSTPPRELVTQGDASQTYTQAILSRDAVSDPLGLKNIGFSTLAGAVADYRGPGGQRFSPEVP